MEFKALRLLKHGVVFTFFISLFAGFFLPVYTDEVGWRFQERAAFDGVDKMFSDVCGVNTLAAPPFFMLPVRYYSAFFNYLFADPLFIRLSGVSYAVFWALLLFWLFRLVAKDERERNVLTITGFGLMSLGVLPLLLVWSRPEQPILLSVTVAIITVFFNKEDRNSPTRSASSWGRSAIITLCAIVAVSYHLKGLVLAPAMLACVYFSSHGRKAILPRAVACSIIICIAAWGAHYWINRLQCPGDPVLAALYSRYNLGLSAIDGTNWLTALLKILQNVDLLGTIQLVVPSVSPMSQWLEADQLNIASSKRWSFFVTFPWIQVLIAGLFCMIAASIECLRNRRLNSKLALALMLLGSVLGWSATQLIRNVYEANFVLPMVMLACLLILSAQADNALLRKVIGIVAVPLGLLAIASPIVVALTYAPSLARAFAQRGYIEAQPYSVSISGYKQLKPDIMAAAHICGITAKSRPQGLMIDDLTYFAFMDSYRPQHRLGVLSVWNGSIADPVTYLRNRHSDGIIVGCHFLSDALRRRAHRRGKFCCLGPPNW